MNKKFLKLILLMVVLYLPSQSDAESFKVVFLNPGFPSQNATGNFWFNVTMFMQAAAKDLDIELITIYAQRNHILMKSLVEEVVAQKPKYVVLVNEKGIALDIIKQLSSHDIASFMLLNNLNSKDLRLLTNKERGLLKGSVIPNNYNAGKKLLNGLANIYQSHPNNVNSNNLMKILALQGDYSTPASLERKHGLMDALNNNSNLIIIDSTVANWSTEQAYKKVRGILRHTRADIIWTANDAMAFGARKAVNELNIDYPVYIGGINWDISPHYPISLSYGGHVTLGAQSLIMLRDIDSNRLAFNNRHQVIDIFESSLGPYYEDFSQRLSQNQLDYYDFSRFSLSSAVPLTFTIENLSKAYDECSAN